MTLQTARETLLQIYLQAATDETFFHTLRKIGVRFSDWPEQFSDAQAFEKNALSKTHLAAVVAMKTPIPEDFHLQQQLTIADVKSIYSEALDFLIGSQLAHKIAHTPAKFREHFENAIRSQKPMAKAYRLIDVIEKTIEKTEERLNLNQTAVVLKGFEKLSDLIDGFNPGRITIITAPTGFGKTNLGISMFVAATESSIKSLFVNMEMDIDDIGKRIAQTKAGLIRNDFRSREYEKKIKQHDVAGWAVNNSDFWITDGSSLSLADISRLISSIKREQDLSLVFVDYDQKIEMIGKDEEWRFLQKAVQELEEMAKREKLHLILFSQANEDGVPRASLRSMQPASAVIFFHKDQEYKLKFLKNRFGPTDRVLLMQYEPETSKIMEGAIESLTKPEVQKPREASQHFSNTKKPIRY